MDKKGHVKVEDDIRPPFELHQSLIVVGGSPAVAADCT